MLWFNFVNITIKISVMFVNIKINALFCKHHHIYTIDINIM